MRLGRHGYHTWIVRGESGWGSDWLGYQLVLVVLVVLVKLV